jgi:hypothetical protein
MQKWVQASMTPMKVVDVGYSEIRQLTRYEQEKCELKTLNFLF